MKIHDTISIILCAIAAAVLTFIAMGMSGCAHTSIYRDGKRVATFQGDMAGMRYHSHADGSVELSGDFDHATATKAQGDAATGKLNAIGSGLIGLGAGAMIP